MVSVQLKILSFIVIIIIIIISIQEKEEAIPINHRLAVLEGKASLSQVGSKLNKGRGEVLV